MVAGWLDLLARLRIVEENRGNYGVEKFKIALGLALLSFKIGHTNTSPVAHHLLFIVDDF
jgi:hypothetical protein